MGFGFKKLYTINKNHETDKYLKYGPPLHIFHIIYYAIYSKYSNNNL